MPARGIHHPAHMCDLIFWQLVLQDIQPFGREFYDRYGEYLLAKSVEPFIQGKVPSLLSFRTERIGDAESRILSECSLEDRFRIFSTCRRTIAK